MCFTKCCYFWWSVYKIIVNNFNLQTFRPRQKWYRLKSTLHDVNRQLVSRLTMPSQGLQISLDVLYFNMKSSLNVQASYHKKLVFFSWYECYVKTSNRGDRGLKYCQLMQVESDDRRLEILTISSTTLDVLRHRHRA